MSIRDQQYSLCCMPSRSVSSAFHDVLSVLHLNKFDFFTTPPNHCYFIYTSVLHTLLTVCCCQSYPVNAEILQALFPRYNEIQRPIILFLDLSQSILIFRCMSEKISFRLSTLCSNVTSLSNII